MKNFLKLVLVFSLPFLFMAGNCNSTDHEISNQQEVMMKEANAQAGLPAIRNFQEKKIMKMIYELRDQENLFTWVYLQSEYTGKLIYVGRGVGYPIPYSTQYSSPTNWYTGHPQAEPNGLFMPSSAEGTWQLMVDIETEKVRPVYFEPRIVVSPFPLQ